MGKANGREAKITCDVSAPGNGFCGVGFVMRDASGTVLRAEVDKFSVVCAEAIAIVCYGVGYY